MAVDVACDARTAFLTRVLTDVVPVWVASRVLRGEKLTASVAPIVGGGGPGGRFEASGPGVQLWFGDWRAGDPDVVLRWSRIDAAFRAVATPGLCAAITQWAREWRWLTEVDHDTRTALQQRPMRDPAHGRYRDWYTPRYRSASDAAHRIEDWYTEPMAKALLPTPAETTLTLF